jgi:hypothetical protein
MRCHSAGSALPADRWRPKSTPNITTGRRSAKLRLRWDWLLGDAQCSLTAAEACKPDLENFGPPPLEPACAAFPR